LWTSDASTELRARLISGVERVELFLDHRHQLAHPLGVEDQSRTGRLEQLGQRPRPAERERLTILADGFPRVALAVAPDLQRAELRDAVFDVVERAAEEVRLLVPAQIGRASCRERV